MADDLAYTPAAELATLIRTRRLSPVELMTATLARIARAQPVLNAFITSRRSRRSPAPGQRRPR